MLIYQLSMANRKISDLTPQMQIKAEEFKKLTKASGVDVLIYSTTRTLTEQARLYRRGRTSVQIKNKIHSLRKRGFGFLADFIVQVGPQRGSKIVTNAGPGESWHNLGEAFDAVPRLDIDNDGDLDIIWAIKEFPYEWSVFWWCGKKLSLEVGGYWTNFVDGPHMQLRKGPNPTRAYAKNPEALKQLLIKNGLYC